MPKLSRRRFVAASAASAAGAAAPAWGATGPDAEIVVIGAGAAGIAAARRVATTRARVIVLEASDRIGGRCFTDTTTFGVPYDRGAHWIHTPELSPIAVLASTVGLDVYPAPPAQKLRIGRRNAREIEMEDYLSSVVRANRAILEAGRGRIDISCGAALPKDLADWQPPIEFVLGPFGCGKNLADISAADFAKSAERDVDAFCREGFGTLLSKLGQGVPVQLSNPVKAIDLSGRAYVEIRTARGTITARAVIVTASTGVLLDNRIRFEPELPRRYTDALQKLTLGSYDHIALELPGNPLGLARDEVVFEKSSSARTGAILANVSGTTLCMVEVGGKFGRDLSGQGAAGDGRVRARMAHRPLRLRGEEGGQAHPRDPVEQGAMGARRLLLRRAGRPAVPHGARRAVPRPAVVCGRSGARDAVGHRRRRLGLRRPRGNASAAQDRRRRRTAARAAGHRRRQAAAVGNATL